MPLLIGDNLQRLLAGRAEMQEHVYDEVLYEVAGRIEQAGTIGKADIGALLFWKRLQANTPWASHLNQLPDVDVRRITAVAVEAVNDSTVETPDAARRGRSALALLPGFLRGDALASALLLAAAPTRMAVYDRRAQAALTALGLELSAAPGRYGRYMELVDELRRDVSAESSRPWTARDVDLALFRLGG